MLRIHINSYHFFPLEILLENLISIFLIKKYWINSMPLALRAHTRLMLLFDFLSPPPSWYPFLKRYFQQPIVERTDICVSEMSSYLIQGRRREREVRLPALYSLTVAGV